MPTAYTGIHKYFSWLFYFNMILPLCMCLWLDLCTRCTKSNINILLRVNCLGFLWVNNQFFGYSYAYIWIRWINMVQRVICLHPFDKSVKLTFFRFVVYFSVLCDDAKQGKMLLHDAMNALLKLALSGNPCDRTLGSEDAEVKPTLLWSMLYVQELTMVCQSLSLSLSQPLTFTNSPSSLHSYICSHFLLKPCGCRFGIWDLNLWLYDVRWILRFLLWFQDEQGYFLSTPMPDANLDYNDLIDSTAVVCHP